MYYVKFACIHELFVGDRAISKRMEKKNTALNHLINFSKNTKLNLRFWLKRYSTRWKVVGSIPDELTEIFFPIFLILPTAP
jgi:hypothetical protein